MTDLYDTLLFDLDGTLTESAPGILRSAQYALGKMGIEVSDPDTLYRFIGPPILESFSQQYGFSPEQAKIACGFFRERFAAVGIFENRPYDGIPALLERLRSAGYRLMLATSKPLVFANRILEHFALADFFSFVGGATLDQSCTQKWEVITHLLAQTGVDPARTLMIGDRRFDVEGADRCGIRCLGVLYGYGSRDELLHAGVWRLASSVDDLGQLLLPAPCTSESASGICPEPR